MFGRKDPIVVKRYDSENKYQKDANKMLDKGYKVTDVTVEDAGRGCLSWGLLGIFNFLRKSKKEYVVTYGLHEAAA